MPAPPGQRIDRPFHEDLTTLFKGMLDMGAGAVRGVTRGTLGLPGDLESLVRLGIGGKQYLPTSEDWDKRLPPLTSLVENRKLKYGENPYDTMGQFFNLPVYGGTAKALGKGVKKFMGKEIPFDASRRGFGKKSAAIGGALLAAPLLKLAKHLDEAAPIAKQADEIAPAAKASAAKAASKYKFNSLNDYNEYLKQAAKQEVDARYPKPNEPGPNYQKELEAAYNRRALQDEVAYRYAKESDQFGTNPKLYEFSPKAKAEMNAFKQEVYDPSNFGHNELGPYWSELLDDYIKWNKDIPY